MLNESAGIKKAEDKRKEREGKKFGKEVQLAKMKEREQRQKAKEAKAAPRKEEKKPEKASS